MLFTGSVVGVLVVDLGKLFREYLILGLHHLQVAHLVLMDVTVVPSDFLLGGESLLVSNAG